MKSNKDYLCCITIIICLCSANLHSEAEQTNNSLETDKKEEITKKKEEVKEAIKPPEKIEKEANTNEKFTNLNVDQSLCSKEILMTFFPSPVVKAVLIQNKVSEADADTISKELAQKDQEVIRLVEERASKMESNPLGDLTQRDTAIKIFRETLFEVFAKTLKANNVKADENQIQTILDDMQQVKGKLFVECIKKERSS
ncbi:MAG: hypothetical protein H0W88_07225 [Parachlamydiaceae bacterium]|nr:hypothetical protein [Parachlamydiaceae bacterium]